MGWQMTGEEHYEKALELATEAEEVVNLDFGLAKATIERAWVRATLAQVHATLAAATKDRRW